LFYIFCLLVALVVIVFVHEIGHFLVARWCKVNVEAFSIGFGKQIAGWTDRKGTLWKVSWIPLGGYVKFKGDANAASFPDANQMEGDDPGNFHNKPIWQRAAVVAAGPLANFLFAILIFAAMLSTIGEQSTPPRVDKVITGSAAEAAGIKVGDVIVNINGEEIDSFQRLRQIIATGGETTLQATIDRQGDRLKLDLLPKMTEVDDRLGGKVPVAQLGIESSPKAEDIQTKVYPVGEAVIVGTQKTWFVVQATLKYVGRLFTGRDSSKQIGGIGSMAKVTGDAAKEGIPAFVAIIALISVSIGLINLFPIPMLDGGHLMFYAIEAVRGKPLGPTAQEWSLRIGITAVVLLMFVGNMNDLMKWMTRGS
jgi:regulator of sigma E protease